MTSFVTALLVGVGCAWKSDMPSGAVTVTVSNSVDLGTGGECATEISRSIEKHMMSFMNECTYAMNNGLNNVEQAWVKCTCNLDGIHNARTRKSEHLER